MPKQGKYSWLSTIPGGTTSFGCQTTLQEQSCAAGWVPQGQGLQHVEALLPRWLRPAAQRLALSQEKVTLYLMAKGGATPPFAAKAQCGGARGGTDHLQASRDEALLE